jgi:hypothetical protein
MVATITRARQRAPRGAASSTQYVTPRLVKSPKLDVRATPGLNRHRSRPVAASSANTRPSGVLTYITPPTTSGVASNEVRRRVAKSGPASPVLNRHATASRPTFSRVTCASGDDRAPPGSPP